MNCSSNFLKLWKGFSSIFYYKEKNYLDMEFEIFGMQDVL